MGLRIFWKVGRVNLGEKWEDDDVVSDFDAAKKIRLI